MTEIFNGTLKETFINFLHEAESMHCVSQKPVFLNSLALRSLVREGHSCCEFVIQQLGCRWPRDPNLDEVDSVCVCVCV